MDGDGAKNLQIERLRILSEGLAHLLSTDDPDRLVRELFPTVAAHLRVDTYFNYMVNEAGDALFLHSYAGIPKEEADRIKRLEFGQAICGRVAIARQAIVATHIQQSSYEPAALVRKFGIQVYACNPLMSGQDLLGTLSFASKQRPEFDSEELEFIRTISQYVAVAFDRLNSTSILERKVRERTDDLLKANERLQAFANSVAHDLRQKIRAIITNASILLEDAGPSLSADNKQSLSRMVTSAHKLSDLIGELLRYAKLDREDGKQEAIDVSEMAAEIAAEQISAHHEYAKAHFVIQPMMHAIGDPSMLRIALENLIGNACKYSSRASHPQIEVGHDDHGFFVKDNGIGFDMQYSHKLFHPFERLHHDSFEGTGIGLASVKRIIERHGGSVSAQSEPGKGATFRFSLQGVDRAS